MHQQPPEQHPHTPVLLDNKVPDLVTDHGTVNDYSIGSKGNTCVRVALAGSHRTHSDTADLSTTAPPPVHPHSHCTTTLQYQAVSTAIYLVLRYSWRILP
eukprot:scpid36586/ scgid22247/ 